MNAFNLCNRSTPHIASLLEWYHTALGIATRWQTAVSATFGLPAASPRAACVPFVVYASCSLMLTSKQTHTTRTYVSSAKAELTVPSGSQSSSFSASHCWLRCPSFYKVAQIRMQAASAQFDTLFENIMQRSTSRFLPSLISSTNSFLNSLNKNVA